MLRATLLATVVAFGMGHAALAAQMNFQATLNTATEVPPKTGPGAGSLTATLDTSTKVLTYTLTFQGLSGPATAAHFHGPAAPGVNAGVVVPITGNLASPPVHGTATLTDAQISQLEGGLWYANVHTAANPGGEIRGQVVTAK